MEKVVFVKVILDSYNRSITTERGLVDVDSDKFLINKTQCSFKDIQKKLMYEGDGKYSWYDFLDNFDTERAETALKVVIECLIAEFKELNTNLSKLLYNRSDRS